MNDLALLIPVVVAGTVVVFFVRAGRQTAKAHARFQTKDVQEALEEFVSPESKNLDTWDLFLAWPINDGYLESVRQRCLAIVRECPATNAREAISPEGLVRVEALLDDLRARQGAVIGPLESPTA